MNNINPLLLIDYYKAVHSKQYPKNMTKIVSYFTPRMSRLPSQDTLVMFGLQGFIKEYLINSFNHNFFWEPKDQIMKDYIRIMDNTLGKGIVDYDNISKLHDLQYLPIKIKAIKEGTRVPIKVPMFEISNTHPDFAWVVNTLESMMSCTLWHTMVSANIGYMYRKIVDNYWELSVDEIPASRAIGDFSMRGQESIESAIKSSAGFCLSFLNSATVATVKYLEQYYKANIEEEQVMYGFPSTEHSVICSNYAVDGDEITLIKRLLKETYPNKSFNLVSDSYDYWNLVNNILPQCKDDILNHKGYIGIRGDSGDPVEIATETVFKLWEIFGGAINKKGYKILNSHVKAVYGDSITPQRLKQIYEILIDKGFACNCVSLAIGSFSMQCLEEEASAYCTEYAYIYRPYTRDTFGIAVKSTYCEVDGKPIQIFKNPKTDSDNFKKSQKGCCEVQTDEEGELYYDDGLTWKEVEENPNNRLKTVFENGKMIKEYSLNEIRKTLHDGKF